jgi:cysteine desulfurase
MSLLRREKIGSMTAGLQPISRKERVRTRFGDRVVLNGHPTYRLPNTLNVSFIGGIGGEILARLPGIAASTGSACHSGRIEVSPVLQAMGVEAQAGVGAIRFSLGRATTHEEISAAIAMLSDIFAVGR